MRILVVDDNVDAADSLALILELRGHTAATAYGGARALELAREAAPDVVFLDIGLPEMDGYAVARCLRAMPALRATTLVALTGWGTEEDKRRAFEAGFDVHLTKPVDARSIDDVIAEVGARELASAPAG